MARQVLQQPPKIFRFLSVEFIMHGLDEFLQCASQWTLMREIFFQTRDLMVLWALKIEKLKDPSKSTEKEQHVPSLSLQELWRFLWVHQQFSLQKFLMSFPLQDSNVHRHLAATAFSLLLVSGRYKSRVSMTRAKTSHRETISSLLKSYIMSRSNVGGGFDKIPSTRPRHKTGSRALQPCEPYFNEQRKRR